MPHGIKGMYELILERLHQNTAEHCRVEHLEMRRRILLHLAHWCRPESQLEAPILYKARDMCPWIDDDAKFIKTLQCLCITDIKKGIFDPKNMPTPTKQQLLQMCGSLVRIGTDRKPKSIVSMCNAIINNAPSGPNRPQIEVKPYNVDDFDTVEFQHRTVLEFLRQKNEEVSEQARGKFSIMNCLICSNMIQNKNLERYNDIPPVLAAIYGKFKSLLEPSES